jgi:3-methylcrotonyl-CoA carboxylase alpha subunit
MARAGVPLAPGYHGDNQDAGCPASARRDDIGYPVLIKASAGGGGQAACAASASPEDFAAALASCRREAKLELR